MSAIHCNQNLRVEFTHSVKAIDVFARGSNLHATDVNITTPISSVCHVAQRTYGLVYVVVLPQSFTVVIKYSEDNAFPPLAAPLCA